MLMSDWPTRETDLKVAAQLRLGLPSKESRQPGFITVSREFGCDGRGLSAMLCAELNRQSGSLPWQVFDREALARHADPELLTEEMLYLLEEYGHSDLQGYLQEAVFGKQNQHRMVANLGKLIRMLARRGHVVLLGKGAAQFTRDFAHAFHVRLVAPLDWRVANHAKRWNIPATQARGRVLEGQEKREAFIRTYLGQDAGNPAHYHLLLNNERLSAQQMVAGILAAAGSVLV